MSRTPDIRPDYDDACQEVAQNPREAT